LASEAVRPVVRFEGGSDGSVLDGLTITGGSAEFGGGGNADSDDDLRTNTLLLLPAAPVVGRHRRKTNLAGFARKPQGDCHGAS
jgi:hypothetical protein